MKNLIAAVSLIVLAVPLRAQTLATISGAAIDTPSPSGNMTLGGVPTLIAQKLQEAKAAGIVDFAGHIGGGAYVPTWTFHDMNGVSYVEALDIGYRALQGQKPMIYLMPFAVDLPAISSRLWNFSWAQNHVTRSKYPDVFVGVGPFIPSTKEELYRLKLKQPKEWMAASASVRFK